MPAPLLTYADIPTRYGVVIEKTPDRLLISVPARSPWARVARLVVEAALCFVYLYFLTDGVRAFPIRAVVFLVISPPVLVGLRLLEDRIRFARRGPGAAPESARFELTRATVRIRYWTVNHWVDTTQPLNLLGPITPDAYAMGLTIRIVGKTMHEMLGDYPVELRRWVAETLREKQREFGTPSAPEENAPLRGRG